MEIIKEGQIQTKIHNIRGVDVMLDSDIALLYGVETKRINEAVKNNPDKFPSDLIFELTDNEFFDLRSKISTANFSKVRTNPKAFTEQGVYMLATILKSAKATETTLAIMRTFVKMRKYLVEHADLSKQIGEIKEELAKNKEWTKEKLLATADAITILEEMILEKHIALRATSRESPHAEDLILSFA